MTSEIGALFGSAEAAEHNSAVSSGPIVSYILTQAL